MPQTHLSAYDNGFHIFNHGTLGEMLRFLKMLLTLLKCYFVIKRVFKNGDAKPKENQELLK